MIVVKKNKSQRTLKISSAEIEKKIINAEKMLKNNKDDSAEKEFLNILNYTNDIEHLYYKTIINNHLGVIYAKRKEYYKSIYRFSSILNIDPNNKSVNNNLMKMIKKLSDLDKKSADEQTVKEVKNDYAKAKELFLEKNFDKLETIAFRLINDYEVNDETALWISFSYCFMGAVLSNQKKYKDAISNYINAAKLHKDNKQAEKMIFDVIDLYLKEEIEKVSAEKQSEMKEIISEKDKIIAEKDKTIKKLKEDNKKQQTTNDSVKNDTVYTNIHTQINNNDEISTLKEKIKQLENENKIYKEKIARISEENNQLNKKAILIKKESDKWKEHSKHYENEFNKLSSQFESFIKIYQEISLIGKVQQLEETA